MTFFNSIFTDGTVTAGTFFLCLLVAIASGIAYAFLCYFKSNSSKSFFITAAMLPAVVAVVIIMVNGNIGAGIAIAGAFSLVRFRSAQGTAKEICTIFVAMTAGLAFGMGYLAYGVLFLIIMGAVILATSATKIWERKPDQKHKRLTVTLPEDLDYNSIFEDLFAKYTVKSELVKVKTVNMGSMFRITYDVTLKNPADEKKFIDEIRTRNGNLEVLMARTDLEQAEL